MKIIITYLISFSILAAASTAEIQRLIKEADSLQLQHSKVWEQLLVINSQKKDSFVSAIKEESFFIEKRK